MSRAPDPRTTGRLALHLQPSSADDFDIEWGEIPTRPGMTFDVTDSAVLAAPVPAILDALRGEASGASHWWEPHCRMRQMGSLSFPTTVGSEVDMTVSDRGVAVHFKGRVVEIDEGRRILIKYFEGAFHGTAEWRFIPIDDVHTTVSFHWVTSPHGWLGLLARFMDIPTGHSRIMQEGFLGLSRHLAQRNRRAA